MNSGAFIIIALVICACVLILNGKDGWGWFLFLACLVDYEK